MNRVIRINIEKLIVICIFVFYASTNSFWGYKLFHDSDIFPAVAACIPLFLCIINIFILRRKSAIKLGLFFLITSIYFVIVFTSNFGMKYMLFYGLCFSLFLLSGTASNSSSIKYFYYLAIVFAIGSLINLLLPGIYKSVILPNFSGSNQYQRLTRWINSSYYTIIPGFTNQTSFNACHFVYGIGYIVSQMLTQKKTDGKDKVALALFIICLVLTNKRAHFLFTAISLVFCYFFVSNNQKKILRIVQIVIGIAVFLVVINILLNYINVGVFRKINLTLADLENEDDITSGRTQLYSIAIDYFLKNPIFGIGWEKYRLIPELSSSINTHNIYLEILCETGIVGAVLFFSFFMFSLVTAIKNCKQALNANEKYISCFCLYMQVFFLLYGLTGNPLYDPPYYIPYFFICSYTFSMKYKPSFIYSGFPNKEKNRQYLKFRYKN